MTNIKATYKDSLFVKMFGDSEKKYLLELYRALHPEDTSMTVDRLKIVSIENVFINDVYNDLGFLADDNRRDIIGQYLAFCTIAKEQYKRYKEQEVAIRETIRICIENGNMVEYLQRHRKEVESYMMAILTQEEAYEAYGDYCTRKGLEQGLEKGIEQGRAEERKIADQQLKQMEQQKNDEIAKLKAELASLKTK